MCVEAGSTTLVFLTMASTISVVEMATPQQHDPFFSSSSFPLKRARNEISSLQRPPPVQRSLTRSSRSPRFRTTSRDRPVPLFSNLCPEVSFRPQRCWTREELQKGGGRDDSTGRRGGKGRRNTSHVSLRTDRHATDRASRDVQSSANEILKPGAVDQCADAEHAVRREAR